MLGSFFLLPVRYSLELQTWKGLESYREETTPDPIQIYSRSVTKCRKSCRFVEQKRQVLPCPRPLMVQYLKFTDR